jgi:hypothetical protein
LWCAETALKRHSLVVDSYRARSTLFLGDRVQVTDAVRVHQLQKEVLDTLTGAQQIDLLDPSCIE